MSDTEENSSGNGLSFYFSCNGVNTEYIGIDRCTVINAPCDIPVIAWNSILATSPRRSGIIGNAVIIGECEHIASASVSIP